MNAIEVVAVSLLRQRQLPLYGAAYFLKDYSRDAAMTLENDRTYYQRRAERQLSIASGATDQSIRAIHLDLAARYATMSELAAA